MATSNNPPDPDIVARQQADALRRFGQPAARRDFLDRAAERRQRRLQDNSNFDRVPIRLVDSESPRHLPDRHPRKVPVVADELVVPAALDFNVRGLEPIDLVPCCDEFRVYRVAPDAAVDIVAVWRMNRAAGAQLNGVSTLGDTVKGPDDPRPSKALAAFPAQDETGDDEPRPFVVVIDTGLDANAHLNGWLARPDVEPVEDVDIDPKDAIVAVTDQPGRDGIIDPCAGHGTFVAGVIRRVAPSAKVRMLRAVDSQGFASDAMVAAAICRSIAVFNEESDGRGVLNLSLGGETLDDEVPPIIKCALDKLPKDVVVVAAAGNEPTGVPVWPAAYGPVQSVAALGRNGMPATWSNFGSTVDFTVPGEGIISTYVEGTDASGDQYDPDSFAIWTGTSFSTPQVAALIAQGLANDPGTAASVVVDGLRNAMPDPDWGTIIRHIAMAG